MNLSKKFILIIVDGVGINDKIDNNAFKLAKTPTFDKLFSKSPWTTLGASEEFVGLPKGISGNSEIGHMTIGSGRVLKHDLVRINESIYNDSLKLNSNLKNYLKSLKSRRGDLHLIGLISDGGVHSNISHIIPIIEIAQSYEIPNIYLHAITDGRDASPFDGINYIKKLEKDFKKYKNVRIATIIGRYFAMDRDQRWERTEKAYKLFVENQGKVFNSASIAIQESYKNNISDEFIEPIVLEKYKTNKINPNDGILCFNFRSDRMRQICPALSDPLFNHFKLKQEPIPLITMTPYHENFNFPVIFPSYEIQRKFGEILSYNNFKQLRLAETEKYAHVTYFMNGKDEKPYDGEKRILIPSPKVPTYDLEPEMSAFKVMDTALNDIENDISDAIIMNLANPDMVGHTGSLKAAIKAVETSDKVLDKITKLSKIKNIPVFIMSDHGNCEVMVNDDTGLPHTAHTCNRVPFIIYNGPKNLHLKKGSIADVAPTILDLIGIKIPIEMTGVSLLK